MKAHSFQHNRAFTLVETLVGAAIGSMILAALLLGSVALLRTFKAVEDYSDASIDQARILDYIARDVRRATTVNLLQNPTRLALTVPDQYASTSKTDRTFRSPTPATAGVVYGSGTVNVVFFLSGKNFIRQESGVDSVIATNVTDFAPVFDLSDPNGKTVKTTITFAAIFRINPATAPRAPTSMTNRVFLRNK
jgi:Tfp pilus assembly protein PilW